MWQLGWSAICLAPALQPRTGILISNVRLAGTRPDASSEGPSLRFLLSHDAEIMLGVLIVVLGLDDVAAPRRVLRHRRVALIVVASVSSRMTNMTERSVARWPLVGRARAPRSRAAIAADWTGWHSAGTLVQGNLRFWAASRLVRTLACISTKNASGQVRVMMDVGEVQTRGHAGHSHKTRVPKNSRPTAATKGCSAKTSPACAGRGMAAASPRRQEAPPMRHSGNGGSPPKWG